MAQIDYQIIENYKGEKMKKLVKITFGAVLVFGLLGCDDSKATESTKNSTQQQNLVQDTVQQQNDIEKRQQEKRDKMQQGALEYIQNISFENYQNTTFKQMLEKWTNFCASVSWDIVKATSMNSEGWFMVTAYCEIKDFAATKEKLQSYYTQKGYKDFSFGHIDTPSVIDGFFGGGTLYPMIPSGEQLITKK